MQTSLLEEVGRPELGLEVRPQLLQRMLRVLIRSRANTSSVAVANGPACAVSPSNISAGADTRSSFRAIDFTAPRCSAADHFSTNRPDRGTHDRSGALHQDEAGMVLHPLQHLPRPVPEGLDGAVIDDIPSDATLPSGRHLRQVLSQH